MSTDLVFCVTVSLDKKPSKPNITDTFEVTAQATRSPFVCVVNSVSDYTGPSRLVQATSKCPKSGGNVTNNADGSISSVLLLSCSRDLYDLLPEGIRADQ